MSVGFEDRHSSSISQYKAFHAEIMYRNDSSQKAKAWRISACHPLNGWSIPITFALDKINQCMVETVREWESTEIGFDLLNLTKMGRSACELNMPSHFMQSFVFQ